MVRIITFKEIATVGKVRYMLVDSCMDKLKVNHEEGCNVCTSVICTALKRMQWLSTAHRAPQQLSHFQSMTFTHL